MTDLLDMMHELPIQRPINPHGSVVQHNINEVLEHEYGVAKIELHQHEDGLWMWSTSFQFKEHGRGYRVGPKWGQFTKTRNDALYWATRELQDQIAKHPEDERAHKTANWIGRLT